jgi:LysM repeat protein
MKISELLAENVHDPKIDWAKFKLAMAALATDPGREGYGKIDGIMFLGLAGDPNSRSVLDVKLKGPARIGVADPEDNRELGFVDPKSKDNVRVAGEYYGNAYTLPDDPSNKGYQIRKEYEYNIIINHDYFDQATGEINTSTLAHEAQHRGFDIISQLPEIRNAVNPRTQKYLDELKTYGQDIAGLGLENTGKRNFLEHLMIYSFEVPGQIGPGPDPTHMFRSKEEVKMFRMMYRDIDNSAVAYIKRHPVPKGGLELLRKEVDRLTPDNVTINIFPDANGKLIVTGFLDTLKQGAAAVADKLKQGADVVADKVKQGASVVGDVVKQGVDKVKSALDIGTTPAKPSSSKPSSELSWYDSLLARIKKNAGLSSKTHVIKTGDTLRKIAQQNDISVDVLIKANPQIKNPDVIFIGDELVIPKS